MTIAQLKDYVASFMNRSQASLVTGAASDLLLTAINNAKAFMQRRHNFQMAEVSATVPNVDYLAGANISGAVLYGTSTPVNVKTLLRAFLPSTAVPGVSFPIDIISRSVHIKRMQKKFDVTETPLSQTTLAYGNYASYLYCVRFGQQIYVYPANVLMVGGATFNMNFDIVQWLPDYDLVTVTSDFLSVYCADFLIYRTLCELNNFLKEDQRFAIAEKKMEMEWNNILAWDSNLVMGSSDSEANLD